VFQCGLAQQRPVWLGRPNRVAPAANTAPIHRRSRVDRQPRHHGHLPPVVGPTVILAPRGLLSIPNQIRTGDMMVMADLGPAHAAEKFRYYVAGATAPASPTWIAARSDRSHPSSICGDIRQVGAAAGQDFAAIIAWTAGHYGPNQDRRYRDLTAAATGLLDQGPLASGPMARSEVMRNQAPLFRIEFRTTFEIVRIPYDSDTFSPRWRSRLIVIRQAVFRTDAPTLTLLASRSERPQRRRHRRPTT
jgi:hypothetical protein